MEELNINGATVRLKNISEGAGEITIHDSFGHNYSYYWGAMGKGNSIEAFVKDIDHGYFGSKLLGVTSTLTYDNKKTFKQLREFIRTEMGLPWYAHMEFQKEMRVHLASYQLLCNDENTFVNCWTWFLCKLDFNLIKCRHERDSIEKEFKGLSEVWNFIEKKPSPAYEWLVDLHKELKKRLQNTQVQ